MIALPEEGDGLAIPLNFPHFKLDNPVSF